jgi:tetratricopeptide (TPR) repeat protein
MMRRQLLSGVAGWTAALALIALAGCRPSVGALDTRDRSEALVRDAQTKSNAGDVDGAVKLYRQALNTESRIARPHLELALLLHHKQKDYLGAICHYRRYLEMRPHTEKREMIEERLRRASQSYQATLSSSAGLQRDTGQPVDRSMNAELAAALERARQAETRETALREHVANLEESKRGLESEVRGSKGELDQLRAMVDLPATRATRTTTRRRESTPPVQRSYKVRRGDTLTSIAADVYGDSAKWREIRDANKRLLGNSQQIKVGQVLVIP